MYTVFSRIHCKHVIIFGSPPQSLRRSGFHFMNMPSESCGTNVKRGTCVHFSPNTNFTEIIWIIKKMCYFIKGKKKSTASCHTPNRVYTK